MFRLCERKTETIDHLVSGSSMLPPKECKKKLDKIGYYIHWKIRIYTEI